MKAVVVLSIVTLLLLPMLVGSAAASVAAALPAASQTDASHANGSPRPLFSWVPDGGYPDRFPFGQCTWWAAYNHRVTWGGDARDWIANAAAQGVATTATPSVGAIVAYRPGGMYSELGHVAIVIAATASSYTVSEMNAPLWGIVSSRVIGWPDPAVLAFIPREAPSRLSYLVHSTTAGHASEPVFAAETLPDTRCDRCAAPLRRSTVADL